MGQKKQSAARAAVSTTVMVPRRLPEGASVFTAELVAVCVALDIVDVSRVQSFRICSDLLSSLQAVQSCKLEHMLVADFFSKLKNSAVDLKKYYSPGYQALVGTTGNEEVDKAAAEAQQLDLHLMPLPYLNFKSKLARILRDRW
jgi:hypothetical protein